MRTGACALLNGTTDARMLHGARCCLQVQAALEGKPLPPPSASLTKAWEDAKREALKSEYSFKPGLVRALAVPLHPIAPDDRPE